MSKHVTEPNPVSQIFSLEKIGWNNTRSEHKRGNPILQDQSGETHEHRRQAWPSLPPKVEADQCRCGGSVLLAAAWMGGSVPLAGGGVGSPTTLGPGLREIGSGLAVREVSIMGDSLPWNQICGAGAASTPFYLGKKKNLRGDEQVSYLVRADSFDLQPSWRLG